jgi:hypothetical protein
VTETVYKAQGKDSSGRKLEPEPLYEPGKKYLLLDKNKCARHNKKKLELEWDALWGCFNAVERPPGPYDHLVDEFDDGLDGERYP